MHFYMNERKFDESFLIYIIGPVYMNIRNLNKVILGLDKMGE
jgi:hypothetical protein